MENKRRGVRVRANAIVSFKVKTTRLVGGSRIKDISETGVCIPSKHFFNLDSILELEIRSEDLTEPVKILARVVRIAKRNKGKYQFEVGVEFLDSADVKQNLLQDYIRRSIAKGDQDISWLD